jgi:hypothetical protein
MPCPYCDDIHSAFDPCPESVLAITREHVREARRKAIAKPLPRNECPGCFVAIYDGAAKQGWCCDCYPSRAEYSPASTRKA